MSTTPTGDPPATQLRIPPADARVDPPPVLESSGPGAGAKASLAVITTAAEGHERRSCTPRPGWHDGTLEPRDREDP